LKKKSLDKKKRKKESKEKKNPKKKRKNIYIKGKKHSYLYAAGSPKRSTCSWEEVGSFYMVRS
jgi:hypothetical protein